MNKNRILIFIIILVVVGAYTIIRQQQSINMVENLEVQALEDVRQKKMEQVYQIASSAQKAKDEAIAAARKAEEEAAKAKQEALAQAKKIEEEAMKKAEEMKAKLTGLVAQAQDLLDSGKFQEAINLANTILGQDPGNAQAKSILDQAKAKLMEAAEAVKGDVENKLKEVGAGIPKLGGE